MLSLWLVIGGGLFQVGGLGFTMREVAKYVGIWETITGDVLSLIGRPRRQQYHVEGKVTVDARVGGIARAVNNGESDIDRLDREVGDLYMRVHRLRDELEIQEARTGEAIDRKVAELENRLSHEGKADARLALWGVLAIMAGIVAQTIGSLM